jgi:hypothetical protein
MIDYLLSTRISSISSLSTRSSSSASATTLHPSLTLDNVLKHVSERVDNLYQCFSLLIHFVQNFEILFVYFFGLLVYIARGRSQVFLARHYRGPRHYSHQAQRRCILGTSPFSFAVTTRGKPIFWYVTVPFAVTTHGKLFSRYVTVLFATLVA